MSRRRWLCCAGALAGGWFTPLVNATPAAHELVHAAFEGLDRARLVDTHGHLLGNGDAGSGCTLHPSLVEGWQPLERLRHRVILGAAGVARDVPSVDRAYVERHAALAAAFPAGARFWLFAFELAHDDHGRARPDWSTFHVPDAHAAAVARAHPRFAWVASIHPYRDDALERLDAAIAGGAVAVKWLPSAMNIDPLDARCRAFYVRLSAARLPLVVHVGEEKAVPGAQRHGFGNPLLLRAPLAEGVTLIAAHAASLGTAEDTDRPSAPRRPAFELFARLMDEPEGRTHLLADVSAVWQVNRRLSVQRTLLGRDDWHGRLLNGSDYPLPGIAALVSLPRLVAAGLLDAADAAPLDALRAHNPLLFDFVLKRRLRIGSARLPAAVFEARALPATVRTT